MTRNRILAAIGLLILPIVLRAGWHYRGIYRPGYPVELPTFTDITAPELPIGNFQTPEASEDEVEATRVVLFDNAHANRFEMKELSSLTEILAVRGAKVEVFNSSNEFDELGLQGRLKFSDAFVVVAPFESYSRSEIMAISDFVDRGGRLLVVLDPTRASQGADFFGFVVISPSDDVASANQLLEGYDLSFSDDYLYNLLENEGNFRNVFFTEFGSDFVTQNLEEVVFYAARSVTTVSGSPLLIADESTLSSATDLGGNLASAALSGDANVLAIGDLTFFTSPYDRVADNGRLILNIADFLLGGERQRNLRDLPFVFSGPVSVVTGPEFAVQAETLPALLTLDQQLRGAGSQLRFPDELSEQGDWLILSLFEPDDELAEVIEEFGLTLPGDEPDGKLVVPGFGTLEPSGLGILGLQTTEGRTALVLLAEDAESLVGLLEALGGGLRDCLLQDRFGLCQLGEGAGFSETSELDFNLNLEPGPEATPSD